MSTSQDPWRLNNGKVVQFGFQGEMMRIAQRILILALGLSMAGPLLTACGSGEQDNGKSERIREQVGKAAAAAKERAAAAYQPARGDAAGETDGSGSSGAAPRQ